MYWFWDLPLSQDAVKESLHYYLLKYTLLETKKEDPPPRQKDLIYTLEN